jgi:signal transduction histidine kinase
VNQPLAAIVTNGEASLRWLARSPPDIGEVSHALRSMIGDARRAGDVIDRIRSLSKKVEPERSRLDLNEVIREVITLVGQEISSHRVFLRLDLATNLSPAFGDRVQLQQVIINLVVNAIQAMARVDDRPRILSIRSHRSGDDEAVVEVQDSGSGIAGEHAQRIFDAFFTTKPNGMGVGLSICRSIIEAHGGGISAINDVEPGAIFRFTLPTSRDAA